MENRKKSWMSSVDLALLMIRYEPGELLRDVLNLTGFVSIFEFE